MGFERLVHVLEVGVEVSEGVVDVRNEVEADRTYVGGLDLLDCEERPFPVAFQSRVQQN